MTRENTGRLRVCLALDLSPGLSAPTWPIRRWRWTAEEIEAVATAINSRPRKALGWKTPAEALDEHLRSLQQAGVATTD